MNVDYWAIGQLNGTTWPTSQLELATHIAADWVPTNPMSIGSGMVNLLGEIIRQETIKGNCAWVAHPDVAQFERQWRGITSYILGVPFCNKVMVDLGYTWWAPVSCFTRDKSPYQVFCKTSPFFSKSMCKIEHVPNPLSPLFPDYVAAKCDGAGGYRIAFFEAKGTARALKNLSTCPSNWHNQVRSAQFIYNNVCVPSSQNVVVATRLDPTRVYPKNRKIQVRAWNNNDPELRAPAEVILEIIRIHYMGVCLRLGFDLTAQALAMAEAMRANDCDRTKRHTETGKAMLSYEELKIACREEYVERSLKDSRYDMIRYARNREVLGNKPSANLLDHLCCRVSDLTVPLPFTLAGLYLKV
jgi:hypothetical protein